LDSQVPFPPPNPPPPFPCRASGNEMVPLPQETRISQALFSKPLPFYRADGHFRSWFPKNHALLSAGLRIAIWRRNPPNFFFIPLCSRICPDSIAFAGSSFLHAYFVLFLSSLPLYSHFTRTWASLFSLKPTPANHDSKLHSLSVVSFSPFYPTPRKDPS